MKKKKDEFYYKNLNAGIEVAYEMGKVLRDTLQNYHPGSLREKLDILHELEQKGDNKKHKMMDALNQAFITPIEREDLVALSGYLDDICDGVEDILLEFYMCNVTELRRDVLPMISLLLECIQALGDVLGELKDFKHSKNIGKQIIRVNELEEKGDRLFVENMHRLHQEGDLRTIMVWRNIYGRVESCVDICEHVADVVETVKMKNS
ncbi:MAG: DUF47 family protein [Lachnospiraceae bacterium]|nr:DUF47 family protein [Lachnospiraceae bacterium]